MSKRPEDKGYDPPNHLDSDAASLLTQIERRLFHLERKVDRLIDMLQDRQNYENFPEDKPYRKNPHLKTSRESEHLSGRRKGKQRERTGDKAPAQPFYSKFRKSNGRSRSDLKTKPFHKKHGKTE